jgi:hypothetical protein
LPRISDLTHDGSVPSCSRSLTPWVCDALIARVNALRPLAFLQRASRLHRRNACSEMRIASQRGPWSQRKLLARAEMKSTGNLGLLLATQGTGSKVREIHEEFSCGRLEPRRIWSIGIFDAPLGPEPGDRSHALADNPLLRRSSLPLRCHGGPASGWGATSLTSSCLTCGGRCLTWSCSCCQTDAHGVWRPGLQPPCAGVQDEEPERSL